MKTPEPERPASQLLDTAALSELISQSEQAESEGREFMQPQAAVPKKKRGRPRNPDSPVDTPPTRESDAPPPPQPAFDIRPACRLCFKITGDWIVRATEEPEMGLLPAEVDALGDAWGAVAERYLPAFLSQYGELVAACAVTATVGARLYTVSSQLIEKKERERVMQNSRIRGERGSAEIAAPMQQ